MLRNRTDPLMAPATAAPSPSQYVKPSFQPGTSLYEVHGSGSYPSNKFKVGRLLGRGGFAKCYEVTDARGTYALKAINRASLDKPKTLQKLHSEIAIHSRMKHKHIVNFIRTFKDRHYVYILLEKADNGTLMDLIKVRPLSVPETQFVMLQCLSAMQYMQENNVIHRDLKPGNIMLDAGLNVKIGDFGLAAELTFDGERKRTVCGTPNYIAPEIIDRKNTGHSFEVDTWSLGVILYTLLVGNPPFQMEDVEATYRRIRACRYDFPPSVPESARNLIRGILQSSPTHRPTLMDMRMHDFFANPLPPSMPPPSFADFHVTFPAPVPSSSSAGAHPYQGRRASALVESAVADPYGKHYAPQPQREILRPINNNLNPTPGGPISPRANVIQKLPPPPVNNYMDDRNTANRAPEPNAFSSRPAPVVPTARRHTSAGGGGGGGGGERMGAQSWRAGGVYDVQFPQIDGNNGNNGAPEAEAPRRSSRAAAAEADADEERRDLTTLHDRLHQTLCVHDEDDNEEAVVAGSRRGEGEDDDTLPSPAVWVTECADFSNKYGMCYKLSTGHTGAHYNDSTKMVWEPITGRVEYYARVRVEVPQGNGDTALYAKDQLEAFSMTAHPAALEKKITLIKYFKTYLGRVRTPKDKVEVTQCTAFVASGPPRLSDPHVSEDFVYVKRWMRSPEALVFRLSNKTVQVCFNDRTEVLLSSEWKVVTYTDPTGLRRTLPLASVGSESSEAAERLRCTKAILYKLIKDNCL